MKKSYLFISVILFLSSSLHFPQSVYEIAPWQGFRSSAVSFTFDDNTPNQTAVAVPLFDEFGFKATFYVITNTVTDWTSYLNAAVNGHEIGSHTLTHSSFGVLSSEEQKIELENSKAVIESHIPSQSGLTFAYPYCVRGDSNLVDDYYLAARGCDGYIEVRTPGNFLNISSLICGPLGSVINDQDFKNRADDAVYYGGWCVYLLHGVDNDGGYSPVTSSTLRYILQYLKDNPENYWVASFRDVIKYIRERNSVTITEKNIYQDSIIISISDTLDNLIYNVPVTVKRAIPDDWSTCSASQNNKPINYSILEISSDKYIVFDALPDNGDVILFNGEPVSVNDDLNTIPSFTLFQNYPNPFNPSTTIKYELQKKDFVTIKVFDVIGNEIAVLVKSEMPAGTHELLFKAEALPGGVYFYQIRAGSLISSNKMVLLK